MPAASAAKPTSTFTDWQPLRLLTFYRVVLAGLLAVLYFALQDSNPFGIQTRHVSVDVDGLSRLQHRRRIHYTHALARS